MANDKGTKKRKSRKLSPTEVTALNRFIKSFDTLSEAADEIEIPRSTLERVITYKSGSPATVQNILSKIGVAA